MNGSCVLTELPASDVRVRQDGTLIRVYFNHQAVPAENDSDNDMCSFEYVELQGRNYGDMVAAIIACHYNNDRMQAVINNHALAVDPDEELSEEKRTEYLEEYAAMQAWRRNAKAIATEALDILQTL
jgi:hypothetical protein